MRMRHLSSSSLVKACKRQIVSVSAEDPHQIGSNWGQSDEQTSLPAKPTRPAVTSRMLAWGGELGEALPKRNRHTSH
jgi:hypothetical protein